MLKKSLFLFSLLMLASCASNHKEFVLYCPNVSITPFENRVTKMGENGVLYKAELIGYEGYCRSFGRKNQTTAVIAPIFEVTRLSPTYNGEISINFFTDTSANSVQSIGRQKYTMKTNIEKIGEKVLFKGDDTYVRIPDDMPGYKINIGIGVNKSEYNENLKKGLGAK